MQFLAMFRAELLDLREIMGFLRMGSSAAVAPGGAAAFQVLPYPAAPSPRCSCVRLSSSSPSLAVCVAMLCPLSEQEGLRAYCLVCNPDMLLAFEPSVAGSGGRGK